VAVTVTMWAAVETVSSSIVGHASSRRRNPATARAPVIVFYIILSRARTPTAPSLRFSAVDVTTLSFSVFYQTDFGGYGGMLYAGGTHYRFAG